MNEKPTMKERLGEFTCFVDFRMPKGIFSDWGFFLEIKHTNTQQCSNSTLWRIKMMLTDLLIIKRFSPQALATDLSLITPLLSYRSL